MATTNQSKCLLNNRNKSRLITKLVDEGLTVKHAPENADSLIVDTAIKISSKSESVTRVENVDLLVILTPLAGSKQNTSILSKEKEQQKTNCAHQSA